MDTTSVAMKKHEKSLLTPKQNNMKHVSVKKKKQETYTRSSLIASQGNIEAFKSNEGQQQA